MDTTNRNWAAQWRDAVLGDEEPVARPRPHTRTRTPGASTAPNTPTPKSSTRPATRTPQPSVKEGALPAWAPMAPVLVVAAWIMLLTLAVSFT